MSQATESKKDDIREAMVKLAAKEGYTEEQFDAMYDALSRGATISDVLGISKESMESGYALAYNLYTAGNYKDAESVFRGLCLYDGNDVRFWMGLGASLQAQEKYEGAAETYGVAAYTGGMQDPTPLFHAGLCMLKLGKKQEVVDTFKAALELGDDANPAHKTCHAKMRALLDTLKAAEAKADHE